MLYVI